MFLTRKIGSVLRGQATPFQILVAALLGGLLGFVPGFFLPGDLGGGLMQAPGLIVLLLTLVLVLNANLGVFGLVTMVAKLLSLVLLPVSYRLGVFLLDGPLQGLFRSLVNGRVSAWFGLEYYATAGGLVVGLVFGLGGGLLLNAAIGAVRRRMAGVEEHSDRYQAYANKRWVRLLTWLLLGKGKGKKTWKDLAEQKKVGMPVRLSGVLVAVALIASLWVFQQWFSTPILTQNVRHGIEAMNGATVDLGAARLDFGSGTLDFRDLAVADSRNLGKDLLAADRLTATVDTGELLRKRFVIDELRSTTARAGTPRTIPGVLLPGAEKPVEPPPPAAGQKTIDDYLQDYEVWKQRLEQARQWIDMLGGGDKTPPAEQSPEQRAEERAEQERLHGIASVVATHLLDAGPRVLIRKIDIEGIDYAIGGGDEKIDLRLRNVADQPSLVADAVSLSIASQSDRLQIALNGRSRTDPAMGFQFALRRLAVDDVFGKLRIGGAPPVRGGTMDIRTSGSLREAPGQAMSIDLPLQVTLKDTLFALAGAKETKVDSLLLPIGLRGPLTQPAVQLDDKALQDALLAAGQKELANFVQGQAGKLLGGLPDSVQGLVDPTKPPEQIVDEAKQKAEAEAKRLQEEAAKKAAEEAKKLLPGGIKGLLPGKKEKP